MAGFIDRKGTAWSVNLTIGLARRLRNDYADGVDLLDEMGLKRLMDSDSLSYSVLWLCCERQAVERKIGRDQFDDAIAEERIVHSAIAALYEAIENFSHRHREPVISAMAKQAKASLIRAMPTNLDTPETNGNEKSSKNGSRMKQEPSVIGGPSLTNVK